MAFCSLKGFVCHNLYFALLLIGVAHWGNAQSPSKPSPTAKSESSHLVEEGFVSIFDGKSFEGWEGNLEWFRIEADSVVAGSLEKEIPNNEFLCSKKRYENFELKLQVKLQGKGNNAGIQFRSERVPNHHEVSGFQCDVGNAFDRPVWGALYDESRRNKMLAEGDKVDVPVWLKKEDWNDLTIRAVNDRIQIWLNGHETVNYLEEDATIAKTGIIGLQIHSGPPTEAWYRNIRIKSL